MTCNLHFNQESRIFPSFAFKSSVFHNRASLLKARSALRLSRGRSGEALLCSGGGWCHALLTGGSCCPLGQLLEHPKALHGARQEQAGGEAAPWRGRGGVHRHKGGVTFVGAESARQLYTFQTALDKLKCCFSACAFFCLVIYFFYTYEAFLLLTPFCPKTIHAPAQSTAPG